MKEFGQIIAGMEPAEALAALLPQVKGLLALLDDEARLVCVGELLGGPGGDKVSSMVNL